MKQVLVKTVPVLARKGTTALVPMVQVEPQTVMETWPWVAPELHVVVEVPATELVSLCVIGVTQEHARNGMRSQLVRRGRHFVWEALAAKHPEVRVV